MPHPDGSSGMLVVLACHCVYDPANDSIYTDRPEFVSDRPVYEAQLACAVEHVQGCSEREPDGKPLLVISGGPTRVQRRCAESRSYVEWAARLGLALPDEVALEEFALTSIENLLLSLYVFHGTRGTWPEAVHVVSWGFKEARFRSTLAAIGKWAALGRSWESLVYCPAGDLPPAERDRIRQGPEREYSEALADGIEAYYASERVRRAVSNRDPHRSRAEARQRYRSYPLPF